MNRAPFWVLTTLLLFTLASSASAQWYKSYGEGIAAARVGNWRVVVQKMSAAISERPKENNKERAYGTTFVNYHPYYYRGLAYLNLGKYEQAIEDLDRATGIGAENFGSIEALRRRAEDGLTSARVPQPAMEPAAPPVASRPLPQRPVEQSPPPPSPSPRVVPRPVQGVAPPPPSTRVVPRPVQTAAPPPSTQPPVQTQPVVFPADQVLTSTGSIAFNSPETMRLGERRVIQLLLDPRVTVELLVRQITEEGKVEGATIKISGLMEAKLSGATFDIRPVTPEAQALSGESVTEWKWEIEPKEKGTHRLFLTINALVGDSSAGERRAIKTFDRAIEVRVPPSALGELAKKPAAWIGLVAAALIALLVWSRRDRAQPIEQTAASDQPTLRIEGPVATTPVLEPDEVVADRYTIVRPLGKGGMGAVYAAKDREFDGEWVALKTILPQFGSDEHALARFKREVQYARKVAHPNVCRIYDVAYHRPAGASQGFMFVTMEYVDGITLAEHIRRRGRLSESESLPIIAQVATALDETHRTGLIHRDLKTANIMLANDGQRAVLMDFGLACLAAEDSASDALTRTGAIVGSPVYMAPEQIERKSLTPATDIYALGVVIYEMITGSLPFEGDTPLSILAKRLQEPPIPPSRRMPSINSSWEKVILKCLARHPADRFESAGEVVRAFG